MCAAISFSASCAPYIDPVRPVKPCRESVAHSAKPVRNPYGTSTLALIGYEQRRQQERTETFRRTPRMSCPLADIQSQKKLDRSPWARLQTLVSGGLFDRSEEHTSELQSLRHLVCRLL